MRQNRSTRDRTWRFNCQQVLEKHSFSNSWRRLAIMQVLLLWVAACTNRLPAVVPDKRQLVFQFNHPFFFGEQELRFDSFHFAIGAFFSGEKKKKNNFAIKYFWETISNRWCYYPHAITAWNEIVTWWAKFQIDINIFLLCILALRPFITNKFARSYNGSFWMLEFHFPIKSSFPGLMTLSTALMCRGKIFFKKKVAFIYKSVKKSP